MPASQSCHKDTKARSNPKHIIVRGFCLHPELFFGTAPIHFGSDRAPEHKVKSIGAGKNVAPTLIGEKAWDNFLWEGLLLAARSISQNVGAARR